MDNPVIPSDKKQFPCCHCKGMVVVPRDLPPTTAPCPYCGGMVTSPANGEAVPSNTPVLKAPVTPPPAPPAEPLASPKGPPAPPPAPSAGPAVAAMRPPAPPPAAEPEQVAPKQPVTAAAEPPGSAPTPRAIPAAKADIVYSEASAKARQFPVLVVLLLCIAIGGVVAYFVTREMRGRIPSPVVQSPAAALPAHEVNYLRIGWQKDASRVLRDFMEATTSADKLPHIIGGETMAARIDEFYGGAAIDDSDTPAASFSVYELSEEDRKRGLFMMTYDQPPQFEMREFFRPLATLEVQHGLDEADLLLTTLARAANFAMEPLRVHAFFKRTPDGLKLDWEIYAQTKYRTFQHFVELPEPGRSAVFRVFIVEDVPDAKHDGKGSRTYRLSDPANINNAARIVVREDSDVGRALAAINWRGTEDGLPLTRTATVELAWSEDPNTPLLQISRFICWEFLGLGGEDPQAAPSKN